MCPWSLAPFQVFYINFSHHLLSRSSLLKICSFRCLWLPLKILSSQTCHVSGADRTHYRICAKKSADVEWLSSEGTECGTECSGQIARVLCRGARAGGGKGSHLDWGTEDSSKSIPEFVELANIYWATAMCQVLCGRCCGHRAEVTVFVSLETKKGGKLAYCKTRGESWAGCIAREVFIP